MSDQYKLIILPKAQKDIRGIILYIARELMAPHAALNLQDEFQKEINSLAKMPKRIKNVDEQPWKDAGIRKTRVKNYYIYFLVDDEEMAVKVNAVIYPLLRERVHYLKETEKGREEMCQIMENRINEEKIELAKKAIARGKLSLEEIAETLSLPLAFVQELARPKAVMA